MHAGLEFFKLTEKFTLEKNNREQDKASCNCLHKTVLKSKFCRNPFLGDNVLL